MSLVKIGKKHFFHLLLSDTAKRAVVNKKRSTAVPKTQSSRTMLNLWKTESSKRENKIYELMMF